MAKSVLKKPGKAPEIGANVGTTFPSQSPTAAISTLPEMIKLYHTGNVLYLGKFV